LMAYVFFIGAARLSDMQMRLFIIAVVANLIIPSYQIILYSPQGHGPPVYMNTHATYPYIGVYKAIHSLVYTWLT
jgi:hypothetical protein